MQLREVVSAVLPHDGHILHTPISAFANPEAIHAQEWLAENSAGGYAETNYLVGIYGITKMVMDGEKVTVDTQYRPKAYECNTSEYKNLDSAYSELVEDVNELRDSLTVVADNSTASYGTPYIWKSYANYIDSQLEEFTKRYYSGMMTAEMLEDYTAKLL